MRADRLVVDTSIIVSALLVAPSTSSRVLDHVIEHGRLLSTDQTRQELVKTMMSIKLDKYVPRWKREALLLRLAPVMDLVQVSQVIRACRDPHDDAILEAAVNGRADAIVTGDKDLLVLHPFAGVDIVTPADYLARVADRE